MEVEKRAGPSRTGVYVILKDGQAVGKVIVAFPKDGAGRLYVALWDWDSGRNVQQKSALGCGYDKLAAAMSGLKFGPRENEIQFTDHPRPWDKQLKEMGYEVMWLL